MDDAMNPTDTVQARPDVVSSELGDGAALLDLNSSMYFSVNAVGACVWRAMERPVTLTELARIVSESFEISPDDCQSDVATLVSQLRRNGLVEVVDA